MTTLLIHQAFVSPNEAGGTRHYEFALRAQAAGQKFIIVASDLSYLTGERVASASGLISEQEVGGVRVLRAYTCPVLHRSFAWRVVSFLSFMATSVWAGFRAGKVDVVMGTSPPIFQAVSAWIIASLRRRPFLLEIRDLWPEFAIDMGVLKNRALIWLSRKLEHFLYHKAVHILVNSPAYREYLIGRGIRAEKISVIPNGVEAEMFDPADGGVAIREEFGLSAKTVVTYAGALGLANDIETLLKAAARLRSDASVHFLIVGDGKERSHLEKTVSTLALSNVTFAGARPKSQMADILAASDIAVAILKNISMFKTTYPNKVFDYMAAGRPTILVIDGVIREVIERSGGGVFVQPGSDEALAAAIQDLSRKPDLRQKMGAAARDYVVKHFGRADQAAAFVALLESLIGRATTIRLTESGRK